jgi:hypothetical protein
MYTGGLPPPYLSMSHADSADEILVRVIHTLLLLTRCELIEVLLQVGLPKT